MRVPVYILDCLVKGSGKPWSRAALEREEDPNTDHRQLASIPKRTASMREKVVCGLQRGSSGFFLWPARNGRFRARKEGVTATWKRRFLGLEGHRCPASLKRTVPDTKRANNVRQT